MRKRILSLMISSIMFVSLFTDTNSVGAIELKENLALNKPVTVSGLEVNDGRFTGEMAVDGIVSSTSRWSAAKQDQQWLVVDLEEVKSISEILIKFHAESPKYKVLISEDGVNYTEIFNEENGSQGGLVDKKVSFEKTNVRYIKYLQLSQWKHSGNGKYYGSSIYELEAYENKELKAEDIAAEIRDIPPTISEDGSKIILPSLSSDKYEISLYGCDNKQVIKMNGDIIAPLEDMNVNLLYKIQNKENSEDVAYTDKDVSIIVPGKYNESYEMNNKPNVVPALREWYGKEGEFKLLDSSKIMISSNEEMETAKTIKFYLEEMVGKSLEIEVGTPSIGDIYLQLNKNDDSLGNEGYTLNIDDYVEISAPTEKGLLYGGISISQSLYGDDNKDSISKGEARDYPKYEVRSGMIDVGRMYIPLEYLEEMTIYMAWFKLNEIQVHINDYWGAANYTAFRLESETYPMINAKDGYYTKEEYKNYQKDVKKYGIDVITEIDTPYHAECFRDVPGAVMLKPGALDIREKSTYEIVENLLDEYLDGEDPIIQSDKFHIGTDEYDKKYSEEMRQYTNHFINYVNNKGYETRLWGSLGSKGFNGTTEVSNNATMNIWAPYWADVKEMYGAGYDIINTCGGWLYIVPGGNAGYPDRLNINELYNNFDVNNFWPNRQPGNGTAIMPIAHPQTKGAEFAVWNDVTTFRGGFSEFDVFDRFKDAVAITAEKTWYGEKTNEQTSDDFIKRVDIVDDKVPGANPGRFVKSEGELVASYDFENVENNIVLDLSENKYDAKLNNSNITSGKDGDSVKLNGDGYINLPMESIGYPYTIQLDIKLDDTENENTEVFSGKDGVLYTNIDGTGKVGFERSGYKFKFDYELPKNKWVNITLTCNQKDTTLFINGNKISIPNNMEESKRKDSTTFILPLEKIGNNMNGEIDNINIYNRVLSDNEIIDNLNFAKKENLSLNKDAKSSSIHPKTPTLTPDKTVDGISSKDSRWASKRATGTGNNNDNGEYGTIEQWIEVDLGDIYKIDKIKIDWEAAYAKDYRVLGSVDGNEYFEIKHVLNNKSGISELNDLGDKEARFIKILCNDAFNRSWGYSIYEIEVYESNNNELLRDVKKGEKLLEEHSKGNKNGNIKEEIHNKYNIIFTNIKNIINSEKLELEEMLEYKLEVLNAVKYLEKSIIVSKDELGYLIDLVKSLEEKAYEEDSWDYLTETLNKALEIYKYEEATWKEIDEVFILLNNGIKSLVPSSNIIISKVSGLQVLNLENDKVTIKWDAPERNIGLKEYVIYKDGKEINRVSSNSNEYTIDNLKSNTIYGIKVTAVYINENESKPISINFRTNK